MREAIQDKRKSRERRKFTSPPSVQLPENDAEKRVQRLNQSHSEEINKERGEHKDKTKHEHRSFPLRRIVAGVEAQRLSSSPVGSVPILVFQTKINQVRESSHNKASAHRPRSSSTAASAILLVHEGMRLSCTTSASSVT
jgi:hypothetical protein